MYNKIAKMVEARVCGFNDAMNRDLKKLAFKKALRYRQKGEVMQEASKNLVEDDYDAKSHLNAVKEAFNEV